MGRRTLLLVAALLVAALGTALVFVYVGNVDERAREGQSPVEVLVAVKDVTAGTSVAQAASDGAFQSRVVPQAAAAPGALGDLSPIEDMVALGTIYSGEQILRSKFGDQAEASTVFEDMPEGTLAVPVQLAESNQVDTFVAPGQDVAVFVTMQNDGPTGEAFAKLLLTRVRVLAVGALTTEQAGQEGDGGSPAPGSEQSETPLLTLALNQKQSEQVFLAQEQGELYVALLNKTSAVSPGEPTTAQHLLTTTP